MNVKMYEREKNIKIFKCASQECNFKFYFFPKDQSKFPTSKERRGKINLKLEIKVIVNKTTSTPLNDWFKSKKGIWCENPAKNETLLN